MRKLNNPTKPDSYLDLTSPTYKNSTIIPQFPEGGPTGPSSAIGMSYNFQSPNSFNYNTNQYNNPTFPTPPQPAPYKFNPWEGMNNPPQFTAPVTPQQYNTTESTKFVNDPVSTPGTEFTPGMTPGNSTPENNSPWNGLSQGMYWTGLGMSHLSNIYAEHQNRPIERRNNFLAQQPEPVYHNKRSLYGDKVMFAEKGGPMLPSDSINQMFLEDANYQSWRRTLPTNLQYEGDYNLKQFWKDNPDFKVNDPQQHMTDKYKKPNHPTFSVESMYYKPGMKAGYWEGDKYIPLKEGEMPKKEKGGWIQHAVSTMRKDHPCTGSKFGSSSCPPGSKRYNLAKTFKKMAKKDYGGEYSEGGEYDIDEKELNRLKSVGYEFDIL